MGLYNTHGTTHIVVAYIGVHTWECRHRSADIGLYNTHRTTHIVVTYIGVHT